MTWGEFVQQMEDAGVKDDTQIVYIDFHGCDGVTKIEIGPDDGVKVT